MMVELTRELQKDNLVHLGKIAKVTGLSVNYLAQLAMPLKNAGLLIGVSGKKGGYQLGREPSQIRVNEILEAVQGPTGLTDCVNNPDICLNSPFCETRMVWTIASYRMTEVFNEFTLADLTDRASIDEIKTKYAHIALLNPDEYMAGGNDGQLCPTNTKR